MNDSAHTDNVPPTSESRGSSLPATGVCESGLIAAGDRRPRSAIIRRMRRTIAAAVVCLAALPNVAHAALPAERPPDPPTLRAAGLTVSWPVRGGAEFAPGDRVVVRVRALRAGDQGPLARVSLVRVNRSGRTLRGVASQSLRDGVFTARLPDLPAARYALRLDVGGRRYFSWITTAGAPGAPPPGPLPPPNPSPRPSGPPPCPSRGTSSFEVRVDPGQARAGDRFTLMVVNTGTTCLTGGYDYGWERQLPDGSWEPVQGGDHPVPAIGVTAQPGGTFGHDASVWSELQPGAYRVVKTLSGPDGPLTVAVPFEVQGSPAV